MEGPTAIAAIASYAAVGSFLGASFALFAGRADVIGDWLARGTVGGGIYGVLDVIGGLH